MQDPKEHTQAVKNLLATAAGPNGIGDDGWHSAGLERLYFQHPTDVKMAGFVEVRRAEDNTEYVRVEMHVPPEIAAELIARVTGASIAKGSITWARREEEQQESVPTEDQVALQSIQASVEKGTSTGLELGKTAADIAEADRARSAELTKLIAEQKDDDTDEDLADEGIEELDFDKAL